MDGVFASQKPHPSTENASAVIPAEAGICLNFTSDASTLSWLMGKSQIKQTETGSVG